MLTRTLLYLAFIAGCDSNLRVNVASSELPSESQGLSLLVLDDVSNDPDYKVSWEAGQEVDASLGFSFHVSQTQACQDPIFSFEGLQENEKKLDFLKDGVYYLCLYGKTKAGAAVAATNNGVKITLDRTPPLISVASQLTMNQASAIEANVTDFLATSPSWQKLSGPGEVVFSNPLSLTPTVSMSVDGVYELLLIVEDLAGNRAEKKVEVTWDTTAPLVSAGPDVITNHAIALAPTADASAVRYLWEKVSGPGTITFSDATHKNPLTSASVDGTYVLGFHAYDAVGNMSHDEVAFTWDTTAPSIAAIANQLTGTPLLIDASVTSIATDLPLMYSWSKVSGPGTISPAMPYPAEDITASADTNGIYVLRLSVTDAAGNTATRDVQFEWDDSVPTVSLGADRFVNAMTSIDATTSLAATYSWTKVSGPGVVTFGSPNAEDTTVSTNADGVYVLRLTVTNASAIHTISDDITLTWDTGAPNFQTALADQTSKDPIDVTGDVQDSLTTLSYAWTKVSGPGTITFSHPSAAATTITADQDGAYVIRLTATDQAGNSVFDELTYTRDTTPPSFVALTRANEASDGYVNAAEATSAAALFALNASGHASAAYTTILNESTPQTCDALQDYSASSIPGINQLVADGTFVICVKLTDAVGNVSYGKSEAVVRDTAPPSFTSLAAANQASDGYVNAAETAATGAAFTLTASGHTLAEYTDYLDETPTAQTCTAGQTYSLAIPVISTLPSTDDAYAVCVRLTDAAGNISYGKSQVITRDATPPTVNVGADRSVNAVTTITTTVSGATAYAWTKQSGTGTVTFGTPAAKDTTASANVDDTYVLRLTATDAAGNSAYDELTLIRDTVAPAASFTGTPTPSINEIETLAVTVGGTDVTHYRYKVGVAATTDCTTSTGYVAEVAVGTPITASVAALDDTEIKLCVVGRDAVGNWQTWASAANATWTKAAKVYAVTNVVMGESFSCAHFANGRIKCWGAGYDGRLGGGNASSRGSSPTHMGNNLPFVDLGSGKKAIKISAGYRHVCAILQDQSLKCWGANFTGQLGLGDINHRGDNAGEMGDNLPTVDVGTGRTVIDVAGGEGHTCALLDDHTVKCWGKNDFGQLGQGNTANLGDGAGEMGDTLPVVNLGSNKKALSLTAFGYATCAILDDHSVKCWGNNDYGHLGVGADGAHRGDDASEMGDNLPALNLGTGRYALQVALGMYHGCALLDTHQIKCWGSGYEGRLGYGNETQIGAALMGDSHNTVALGTGRSVVAVAAGYDHTCALLDDSSVKCWGRNTYGALGLGHLDDIGDGAGEMGDSLPAVSLGTGRFAIKLAVSNHFTCAVLDNSRVKCWGRGEAGRLGQGSTVDIGGAAGEMGDALSEINLLTGGSRAVLDLVTRESTSCAILDDHTLKCWGRNANGALGYGDTTDRGTSAAHMGANLPVVDVGTGRKVLQVGVGTKHTCALLDNRTMKCWGLNTAGALGLGHTTILGDGPGEMGDALPAVDLGGKKVFQFATAYESNCALLEDSTLKCWGNNYYGELGLGDVVNRGDAGGQMGASLPTVNLGTGKKAVRVVAGWLGHCVILQDRSVKCWGRNQAGQLGYGDTTDRGSSSSHMGDNLLAVNVGAGRRVIAMPDFYYTPCVKLDDGSAKCWGSNSYGQVGVGTATNVTAPSTALSIGANIRAMAPGFDNIGAITAAGALNAWGRNFDGRLGFDVNAGANVGDDAGELGVATPTIGLGAGRFPMKLSAATAHFCALTDMARVKCWGANSYGELGLGDAAARGDNDFELGDYLPFSALW